MPVSDERLMQQFQNGDRAAFATLVQRHHQHALHFCERMLHDRDLAQDAAQEGFARILLHPEHWHGHARFTSYLFAILKNLCLDELRWQSRWRGAAPAAGWDPPDPAPLPDEQLARAEQERTLREALETLSADHRAALILREYQELSYAEIAEAMDWSAAKTKITIYRARLALGRAIRAREESKDHAAAR